MTCALLQQPKALAGLTIEPRVLLLVLLFSSLPATGRQVAAAQQEGTIEGKVTDAADGHPVAEAQVSVSYIGPNWQLGVVTGADGRSALRDLRPGRFNISVYRPGYVPWPYQRAFRDSSAVVSILPGQHLKDLVVTLVPAAVVTGRLTDEHGGVLSGVSVQALRETCWQGRHQWDSQDSTSTDLQGEYRLQALRPGQYYISVTDMSENSLKSVPEKAHVPFYYPGTLDPAQATKTDVRAGAETRADITLPGVRTLSVFGRIINALTRKPAPTESVFLFGRLGDVRFYAGMISTDKRRGSIEIRGLVSGTYTLFAKQQPDPLRDRWISGWKVLEVGETDLEGVTLPIGPGARVSGRVRVEGGTKEYYTGLSVVLDPRDDVIDTEGADPVEGINRDGTFLFKDVLPGTYDVRLADQTGNFFLRSVTQGGEELLVKGLQVSPPQAPSPLSLTICANAGRIEGVVLDLGQPAMQAAVVLIPAPPHPEPEQLVGTAVAGEHGGFLLRGIAPGDYQLFAWGDVDRVCYRSADLLRPYENAGVPVHVTEGGKLKLNLQLIPD